MNGEHHDALARLRQAVGDLEKQVEESPEQARVAVCGSLYGALGIGYAIHVVTRITEDISHITRQQEVPE